jgi:hypothetical protein
VNGDGTSEIKRVVELAIQLYLATDQAAFSVRRETPLRSFGVTGTLSIEGRNEQQAPHPDRVDSVQLHPVSSLG